MRTIQRYLRREVLVHAGLGLLLFTFVIFMQDLGRALEAVVRAGSWGLAALFAYVLPQALVFTLPMAVLVGVLIGLGRLGVDNELVAMRACGVGPAQLLRPLLEVAAGASCLALCMTLWLAPASLRQLKALTVHWASAELSGTVQPRVFFEPGHNPDWVIYTGGTAAGGRAWRHVLVADMHDPASPQLTLAASGEVVRRRPGQVQLHLVDGAQYSTTAAHPETSLVSSFRSIDIPFTVPVPASGSASLSELSVSTLWQRAHFGPDWRAARVELYRRFALAFACLALALLGIPLGLRGGRGGRSGGLVLTLILVFGYYLVFILGMGLAKQGKLPPFWGVWAANLLFAGGGIWAMFHLERVPGRPWEGVDPVAWARAAISRRLPAGASGKVMQRRRWMPSLLEGYVLREFLGYTGVLLGAFLILVLVFTLFELIGSILQHHIPLGVVLEYLLYFSPQMLYMTIPLAILVAVLLTFGLMSKSNEIVALKASGVSVYRLLAPVLAAAVVLCALQFALDATFLPEFNLKQDALHSQIKGQAPRSFTNPEHKWVFGQRHDIYYFSFYNPDQRSFADVSVFEFDPHPFVLTRRIFARAARWDDAIQGWIFTDGWTRAISSDGDQQFQRFQVASFPRLSERPAYFATDARQGTQMTYTELRRYIHSLQRSGYNVARLSVTLARKIAYPLITVIMALLAFPFALSVGRRGAVAGISVAIGVAIAYWTSASLLQALGNLNQLPALVAAWTPDAVFLGVGMYLLLRVPT